MAFDTHAAVKTLTDAGANEALAVAVVEVAREADCRKPTRRPLRLRLEVGLNSTKGRAPVRSLPGRACATLLGMDALARPGSRRDRSGSRCGRIRWRN